MILHRAGTPGLAWWGLPFGAGRLWWGPPLDAGGHPLGLKMLSTEPYSKHAFAYSSRGGSYESITAVELLKLPPNWVGKCKPRISLVLNPFGLWKGPPWALGSLRGVALYI